MEKIKCPGCGRENLAESETCWACYALLRPRAGRAEAGGGSVEAPGAAREVPIASAADEDVTPPSAGVAAGRLGLVLLLAFFYSRWWSAENYFSPLDHANLAFHEAGHIFLMPFGRFLMTAGGTLFQLLVPAVCGIQMYRQGSRLGWQLCLFWAGESLLNISIYAGDAIAQALPLTAGGVHDWTYLLTETGLIAHTRTVGRAIFSAGSAVALAAVLSIGWDGLSSLAALWRRKGARSI